MNFLFLIQRNACHAARTILRRRCHTGVLAALALTVSIGFANSTAAPIDELPPAPPAVDIPRLEATRPCAKLPRSRPAVLDAAALQAYSRCAQDLALTTCRSSGYSGIARLLATRFSLSETRVTKGLQRLNGERGSKKDWCDVTVEDYAAIVSYAAASRDGRAEHRADWIRFTLGDENGNIEPDGLARAIAQRRTLLQAPVTGSCCVFDALQSPGALPPSPAGWTNLTGYVHPVGRINDLLIHPASPNTMWAGADGGGIWKTTDGGASWQPMDDFLGSLSIASFAMAASDPNTIYVATGALGSHGGPLGAGVFKSVDGGNTWSQVPSTSPSGSSDWKSVYRLAIHPGDSSTLLAATAGGAYITTDGGSSWTKLFSGIARSVAIHPANGNLRVIALDDGTIRVTADGSTYASYTIVTATAPTFTQIALSPSNQNVMYALVRAGGTQLYRSATGGSSWALVPPPTDVLKDQLSYTEGLWVDPHNENHIGVAEFWAAVTSDASAATPVWKKLLRGWVDFHGIVAHPGYNGTTNKIVYFMDDGGLYKWTDVDTVDTVEPAFLAPNGMTVTQVYSVSGRGGNVILGAQDVSMRVYGSEGTDNRWQRLHDNVYRVSINGDGMTTAADRSNPNVLYGSRQELDLWRSTDGGATATKISPPADNPYFYAPFVLDPSNQNRMLAGAASLWRADDVSTATPPAWGAIHSGVSSKVVAIAVAPSDSNVIWVAYLNGEVYKTVNGTDLSPEWTKVTTLPSGNKLRIAVDRTDPNRVYVGYAWFLPNRLQVTQDGGNTWTAVPGLPGASIFAIAQHPYMAQWLYVGTAVGLFVSEDGGATWSTSNYGPANVQVRDLAWYSESGAAAELLVGTFGRGVWRASLNPNASPGTIKFQSGAYTVAENATGGATLGLVRSTGTAGAVSVNYSTADGSATAGSDYTPVSGTVSWADGDTSVKTISIPLANDGVSESDETITLTLSSPGGGATLGTPSTATLSITDPDQFPYLCQMPAGWFVPSTANAGWVVATDQAYERTCSLKSAPIADGQAAEIAYTGDFSAGYITFRSKVSSQTGFDNFRFYVDGFKYAGLSGEADWTYPTSGHSFWVPAGTHTITFRYEKDSSCCVFGSDSAWIDAVTLPLAPAVTTTSATTTSTSTTTTTAPAVTTTTTASSTTTTTASTTTTTLPAVTLNLSSGWNLVGNGSSATIDLAALFGDSAKVVTVWKWLAAQAAWAFYTPLANDGGAAYARDKGYQPMTAIDGGEGFWVNVKTPFTASLPSGTTIESASFQIMGSGWSLVAIGDNKTPREFNNAIGMGPSTAGDIQTNLTTLWAWDALLSNWYFYAPSLDKSGGLASYIASKNYLDFGTKALGPTTGFWVNKP